MFDPHLFRRVQRWGQLETAQMTALANACGRLEVIGHTDLLEPGAGSAAVLLITAGYAVRETFLPSGRRQILELIVPGDLCDVRYCTTSKQIISSLTRVSALLMTKQSLDRLLTDCPRIGRAMWFASLVGRRITQEWLVNVGRRSAVERVAHFLSETFYRLRDVERTSGHSFELPMTQVDLGDALALSAVHINRVLQELRHAGLIELAQRRVTILDLKGLNEAAAFQPSYLHLHNGSAAATSASEQKRA